MVKIEIKWLHCKYLFFKKYVVSHNNTMKDDVECLLVDKRLLQMLGPY